MARKKTAPATSDPADTRLEPRLRRLDEIVLGLERDDLELEDALRLFEEGVGHIRAARRLLEQATQRVEQLLELEEEDRGGVPQ